jgi:hypothetical protein
MFFPAKRHAGMYAGMKIDKPDIRKRLIRIQKLNWPDQQQRDSWHGVGLHVPRYRRRNL